MWVRLRRHDSSWEGTIGGAPGRWVSGTLEVELPDGATVADLLTTACVDEHLVCLVVVNGRSVDRSAMLSGGDSVDLIPPVTGGC